jgi:hypothetical protein
MDLRRRVEPEVEQPDGKLGPFKSGVTGYQYW